MSRRVKRSGSDVAKAQFQSTYHRGQSNAPSVTKRKSTGLKNWLIIVFFALLSGLAIFALRIDRIEVLGVDEDTTRALQSQAESRFKFQWQVNDQSVREFQSEIARSVGGIDYTRSLHKREIYLEVLSREPVMVWSNDQGDYLVDVSGVVIEESNNNDLDDLPVVFDQANLPVEEGEQVVPAQFVAFIVDLHNAQLDYRRLSILETSAEVHLEHPAGYKVYISTGEELKQQLDNLQRVQAHAKAEGETIEEYIDLRLPYKAYYR